MKRKGKLKLDEVGYWSEVKLDIVKEYAAAYSRIMSAQKNPPLYHVYIDAFAGAGIHISKTTGELITGSPLNALCIDPPFREFYLIDLNKDKTNALQKTTGDRKDVHVIPGDCNEILISDVFPKVKWEDYRRGLCLLDPYGLHLNWELIKTAGRMKSIDLFLNFPIGDMNRNVLRRDPDKVDASQIPRMNAFWGDESWRDIAYTTEKDLFEKLEKEDNETIARAFKKRLRNVAGFKNVPDPIPMRNSIGSTIYYLFFASQKDVANKIVLDIFRKYRNRGAR